MSDSPKFMIAEDPRFPDHGRYIFKMTAPVALIGVFMVLNEDDEPELNDHLIGKTYRHKMIKYHLVNMPFNDGISMFQIVNEIEIHYWLDEAFEWYKEFIDWEEKIKNSMESIFKNITPPQI